MKLLYKSIINKPLELAESVAITAPEGMDLIIDAPILLTHSSKDLTLILLARNITVTARYHLDSTGTMTIGTTEDFFLEGGRITSKRNIAINAEGSVRLSGLPTKSLINRELHVKASECEHRGLDFKPSTIKPR